MHRFTAVALAGTFMSVIAILGAAAPWAPAQSIAAYQSFPGRGWPPRPELIVNIDSRALDPDGAISIPQGSVYCAFTVPEGRSLVITDAPFTSGGIASTFLAKESMAGIEPVLGQSWASDGGAGYSSAVGLVFESGTKVVFPWHGLPGETEDALVVFHLTGYLVQN